MKEKTKHVLIITIGVIILLIPTIIAISSYYSHTKSDYKITVYNENYESVTVPSPYTNKTAELILKASRNLTPTDLATDMLPQKYYYISIKKKDVELSSFRWYIRTDKNTDSYAVDKDGKVFLADKRDIKRILSQSFTYHFYENSSLPRLSINGGDEIIPQTAKWSFKEVGGSIIRSPGVYTSSENLSYPIDAASKLSFTLTPQKCSIKVYDGNELIGNYSSVDDLPLLKSGWRVKIKASWRGNGCKGNAYYEFSTEDQAKPVYSILDTTILAGEFITVKAENVKTPRNIEFSSIPEIHTSPTFFPINGELYALIPISKELSAPCNYTFIFKYGNDIQRLSVSVEARTVRHDKECEVFLPLNDENLGRVYELFERTSHQSGNSCSFGDGFVDYSPNDEEMTIASVFYGFGHSINPTNGLPTYRLDGVIYIFPSGADIPSVCDGRVILVGDDPILGHYVAVDHGLGLMTWYCRLGSSAVSEGNDLSAGDTVGISGNTGFGEINGVYLITTVGGVPVSPYPLQNETLSLFD